MLTEVKAVSNYMNVYLKIIAHVHDIFILTSKTVAMFYLYIQIFAQKPYFWNIN